MNCQETIAKLRRELSEQKEENQRLWDELSGYPSAVEDLQREVSDLKRQLAVKAEDYDSRIVMGSAAARKLATVEKKVPHLENCLKQAKENVARLKQELKETKELLEHSQHCMICSSLEDPISSCSGCESIVARKANGEGDNDG